MFERVHIRDIRIGLPVPFGIEQAIWSIIEPATGMKIMAERTASMRLGRDMLVDIAVEVEQRAGPTIFHDAKLNIMKKGMYPSFFYVPIEVAIKIIIEYNIGTGYFKYTRNISYNQLVFGKNFTSA